MSSPFDQDRFGARPRGKGRGAAAPGLFDAVDQLRDAFEQRFAPRMARGDVRAAVLALLVQLWRGRSELQPWILDGAAAVMVQGLGLGAPWPVLAGAFAGAGYGAWRDTRGARA